MLPSRHSSIWSRFRFSFSTFFSSTNVSLCSIFTNSLLFFPISANLGLEFCIESRFTFLLLLFSLWRVIWRHKSLSPWMKSGWKYAPLRGVAFDRPLFFSNWNPYRWSCLWIDRYLIWWWKYSGNKRSVSSFGLWIWNAVPSWIHDTMSSLPSFSASSINACNLNGNGIWPLRSERVCLLCTLFEWVSVSIILLFSPPQCFFCNFVAMVNFFKRLEVLWKNEEVLLS